MSKSQVKEHPLRNCDPPDLERRGRGVDGLAARPRSGDGLVARPRRGDGLAARPRRGDGLVARPRSGDELVARCGVDDVAESPPEAAAVGPRGDQAPVGDYDGVSPSFKRPVETERINSFRD